MSHSIEPHGRIYHYSTRAVFLIAGLCMAAWAPLVPYAKERARLDDGMLGLLLLCLGGGSVVAMPMAGALCSRIGCRWVIAVCALMCAGALPLLAWFSTFPLLVGALLMFGAGMGGLDVAMNVQAVLVERANGKAMMSGFHGMFSAGGIVGAAGATALLNAGVSPVGMTLVILALSVLLLGGSFAALLPYGGGGKREDGQAGPLFAFPKGVVLFYGIICFVVFMAEGSVLDWGALLLQRVQGVEIGDGGKAYAAFAATMTVGRLGGDWIVSRFGSVCVTVVGGLMAAIGVGLVVSVPQLSLALAGYALIGLGCSNIVPVMFSRAGRQTTMPESVAIPAITTMGYAGILIGPAAIGFVAQATRLQIGFLLIGVLLLGVAISGRYLR